MYCGKQTSATDRAGYFKPLANISFPDVLHSHGEGPAAPISVYCDAVAILRKLPGLISR